MKDERLIEKIKKGLPLDSDDEQALDSALSSSEQQQVAQMVSGITSEIPSLAWRSELNEKLMAINPHGKSHKRLFGRLVPGLTLACCVALGLVLWNRIPTSEHAQSEPGQSIEAVILSAHENNVNALDVSSVCTFTSTPEKTKPSKSYDLNRLEIESL